MLFAGVRIPPGALGQHNQAARDVRAALFRDADLGTRGLDAGRPAATRGGCRDHYVSSESAMEPLSCAEFGCAACEPRPRTLTSRSTHSLPSGSLNRMNERLSRCAGSGPGTSYSGATW